MIFVAYALVVESGSESRVLVVEEVILADCNPEQAVALTLQRGSFESSFPEIVSFVDNNFRTLPDKAHRAIAGLSMGGMHTLMISANYPEMFNYIGLYSAGVDFTHIKMEEIKAYANLDAKLAKLAQSNPKLYWIACGDADRLMPFNRAVQTDLLCS